MDLSGTVDVLRLLFHAVGRNVLRVAAYPFNPAERLFILYLISAVIIAAVVHRRMLRQSPVGAGTSASLKEFLFPRSTWRTASAWLDVRYFFFHQILRVSIYSGFVVIVSDWTFQLSSRLLGGRPDLSSRAVSETALPVELAYAFISIATFDLVAYALHYCQHRFAVLWEFHKVHHSATAMHPLTNYREHPVDNLTYAAGLGACTGLVAAAASAVLGYVPAEPTVLGVGLFVFAYNVLGYNLRHSHVWLRWPGPLVYMFGSPAHHQVHHSYHPEHMNKNFAFIFPFWDVLFRTFHVPATNADVKFGLHENQEELYRSCLDLYWLPFRNLWTDGCRSRQAKARRFNSYTQQT